MNSLILAAIGVAAILMAAISVAPLAAAASNHSSEANKLLAQVRQSTAQYHNPANAIADGYVPTDECVPEMGYHYANFDLFEDLETTELKPEAVLYAPSPNGLKLVAVEYIVVALANTLEGPMPGHEPGMPWHYDLHVWVWDHNPDGMFAAFNPTISCTS